MEKILIVLAGVAAVLGLILLLSLPAALFVMLLWNWVMVDVFALPELGFWQAWGLYLLASILFKNSTVSNKSQHNG